MTTAYDVPADALIQKLAEKLREDKIFAPPEWSRFVRTGIHTENPPMDADWWYVRCASVLRKIYIRKCIGVERLRAEYGGKRDRGSKPYHAVKGSGAIIRRILQRLEDAGYVTKIKGKGRVITPKGQSFVDNTAHEVKLELLEKIPELKKY
ncbi:MAG TPA: 30S ribosomal protein S19e [Thermoplasmatales archaeon]|nr:30S ribosomal protein S19e [Thermoplasmatales archaeon]